jgi:hypothetical protein
MSSAYPFNIKEFSFAQKLHFASLLLSQSPFKNIAEFSLIDCFFQVYRLRCLSHILFIEPIVVNVNKITQTQRQYICPLQVGIGADLRFTILKQSKNWHVGVFTTVFYALIWLRQGSPLLLHLTNKQEAPANHSGPGNPFAFRVQLRSINSYSD